jgi:SAM-dependent methyltransferase
MTIKIPKHWQTINWEAKAQENPLFAIMSTEQMADAPPDDFSPELLAPFFRKGEVLFSTWLEPLLSGVSRDDLIVEYGCGAGRILKAASAAGYRCAGVDIAPTMIEHCRTLVPDVANNLYCLDAEGRCELPSQSAAVVFSYAVVQHIATLSRYVLAIDEMCRILRPGGKLRMQVNCEDFQSGDLAAPWRTENFETYSLHFRPGESEPYRHNQDAWSGVYVGYDYLRSLLAERGLVTTEVAYLNDRKLRAVWVTANLPK